MGERTITSSTGRMTFLTNNILSILIIVVTKRRTDTIISNFHPFCLFLFIITSQTCIFILTSHTVISARGALVLNSEESTRTNTWKGVRINNFKLINATFLTVRIIFCDHLTIGFWTFFKAKILIDERTIFTVWTDIFMFDFQSNKGKA